MITVVARNFVKPGCLAEFLAVARVLEEETNKYDAGCIHYAMYQNVSDELDVTCMEEWESREAMENHLKSTHFAKTVEDIRPYCAGATEVTLYQKLF